MKTIRMIYLMGFISISVLLGVSLYLEFYDGMTPCPLCLLQRVGLGLVGVSFFFGAMIHFKKIGHYFIVFLSSIFTLFGLVFAARQVWLQHLPPSSGGECGASLEYMLQVLPVQEVLKKVFIGGTECSQVTWRFLSLSLAEWSLVCFLMLLITCILQLHKINKNFSG